ncbi:MAG: hypothetical protein M3372_03990 [Verrucomicrobiota bacterium]|nr:hypothetical protein [Verrucomicrobiota bacterium]
MDDAPMIRVFELRKDIPREHRLDEPDFPPLSEFPKADPWSERSELKLAA